MSRGTGVADPVLAALRDAAADLRIVRTRAMGGGVSGMLGSLFRTGEPGPAD